MLEETIFDEAVSVLSESYSRALVARALARWQFGTEAAAKDARDRLLAEFPDDFAADEYWTAAKRAKHCFRDFFTWGHDHDFGFGFCRAGAMASRHVEIAEEAIQYGLLPPSLNDKRVLNVGCWSGGDTLLLAGLGGSVVAIEEHCRSASSARRLSELVGCDAVVETTSLYQDQPAWGSSFDLVYCSGVLYHVTDPILLLRICFAYLRPGGQLLIETKAEAGSGSICSYAGSMVPGWNWFAPNREALGRLLVDCGFSPADIRLFRRPIGRLMASARKAGPTVLPETAGFSRPGSWLAGCV
ncbi:MAG: methyltransferase domain-containing protein [Rhodospirillaceae bacterium]